jgi:hypothetical protein
MKLARKLPCLTLAISLSLQTKCLSQVERFYPTAYHYVIKSKELESFRDEVRVTEGIITRKIIVVDSVIPNNPYLFLCSILKKKTKKENCSQSIGAERLKTFDSLRQEYSNYNYSKKSRLPFNFRGWKPRRTFVLFFSDVYQNTFMARLDFRKGKILFSKSQLFYFAFLPNGKIKNVYTAEIQNYRPK